MFPPRVLDDACVSLAIPHAALGAVLSFKLRHIEFLTHQLSVRRARGAFLGRKALRGYHLNAPVAML